MMKTVKWQRIRYMPMIPLALQQACGEVRFVEVGNE